MDSQKRLILALGLCFLLTVVCSYFFNPAGNVTGALDAGMPVAEQTVAAKSDAGVAAPVQAVAAVAVDGGQPVVAATPPARTIEIKTPLTHYTWSSVGGGLTGAPLQGKKMREQPKVSFTDGFTLLANKERPDAPAMDMARPPSPRELPLSVGVVGNQPLSRATPFKVEEGKNSLTFTGVENNWEITKVVSWPEEPGFELRYDITLKNLGSSTATGDLAVHFGRAVDPEHEEKASAFGSVGNQSRSACKVGEEFQHQLPKEDTPEGLTGPVSFFGVDQQYFLAAVFPLNAAAQGRCELKPTDTERSATGYFPLSVEPGMSVTQSFGVYIGPKDLEILKAVPLASAKGGSEAQVYRPELEKAVDLSIWAVISNVMLGILKFLHRITHNWGVSIILLTLLVRAAMVPLAHKSMVSAEAMKKLQPKMEELRKKYADDRDRQNMEMMKLYKEGNVNPLGGCLPLLIQMPIWFALLTTLRTSYEIYREPFFGPIWFDLTYKDPIFFLPVALGLTQIITMKLQPQMTMDQTQAKMMTYVMPVMFTAFMLNTPSGLSLYIFTSNLFQIAQQWVLRKYLKAKETSALAPAGAVTGRKR
ncbi:MAG: membrane protein insertase YidC [Myxococcaceae bacterium]